MYKRKPIDTYESVNKVTMSGRDVEAEVLTKAAIQLKACQDNCEVHPKRWTHS